MSFFSKLFGKKEKDDLNQGLEKTKRSFWEKITRVFVGKTKIDDEILLLLEESLLGADVGVQTTSLIMDRVKKRVQQNKYENLTELNTLLQDEIAAIFHDDIEQPYSLKDKPHVILIVGVNGVGKTTSIGKLAYQYKRIGCEVVVGAADTFRAAAIDQLVIWSERAGVDIIKQTMGSDPSAVAFDTIQYGIAKKKDIILIDTAGRLHNKIGLMDELAKMKRVISKAIPSAPHQVLLVLDGATGQNAIAQAKQFSSITPITGIIVTKLDGTAKGGVVLAIAHELNIPIQFIGVGEKIDQLLPFNKHSFVKGIFQISGKEE